MPPNTPNLDLIVPDPGGSNDVWGDNLNTDLAKIDAKFAPSGPHVVVQTNADGHPFGTSLVIDDATGTFRQLFMRTAGIARWSLGPDSVAEGIGNVGCDFSLFRYGNDGVTLDAAFPTIHAVRSSGIVQFGKTPQVIVGGTPFDVVHTGNITSSLASVVEPVGTLKMYAGVRTGSTDPSDFYLFCDGRSFLITTYPALYAAIGRAYTDTLVASDSFQIPNTAARVIVGKGPLPADWPPTYHSDTLGASFGVGLHRLIIDEIPHHNHTLTDHGHTHNVGYNAGTTAGGGAAATNFNAASLFTPTTSSTTGITIDAIGGDLPHDNVQPSLVMNFIIRVK
jgi:microcystin-dependent protein